MMISAETAKKKWHLAKRFISMSRCYPPCPSNRIDCRFQSLGGMKTLMYSPISYDREGNAVGGGANTIDDAIKCNTCNSVWTAKYKELDRAQRKPIHWAFRSE